MVAAWLAGLAVAALLLAPADALAKQRGNGRLKNNGNGNGPAFCRRGAGHPVHGWAWCRERGWSRDGSFDRERGRDRDDRARQRDDRDRDRSERSRFPWPF
jgi:hypothetical protein